MGVKQRTAKLPHPRSTVVATNEIEQQILKIGIRKLERATGVSRHTIKKILKGEQIDAKRSPGSSSKLRIKG
jgi:DNA invertase Pin-like site-specific DNA recombinase